MDKRLIVLKLFMDELEVPSDIDTLDDRKRVQKAVYLGQLTGVDLSYRFGWYLMGPYSPALTKDYYNLAEAVASGDRDYERHNLHKAMRDQLGRVRPIMDVPEGVTLTQENWLELLSSLHFLLKVRKLEEEEASNILNEKKPHLVGFVDKSKEKLQETELLA